MKSLKYSINSKWRWRWTARSCSNPRCTSVAVPPGDEVGDGPHGHDRTVVQKMMEMEMERETVVPCGPNGRTVLLMLVRP